MSTDPRPAGPASPTPLLRPMVARDRDQEHRASTPLELLFDLCFVVAVSQAAAQLHHQLGADHVGSGVGAYLMVFFAIWWGWVNFSWFASAYDTDDVPYRLLTLLQAAGVLVLAAGVQQVFEDHSFAAVVVGYVIMRVALIAQWLRAARNDRPRRGVAGRFAVGVGLVQLGWIARLAVPEGLRLASFLSLVAAELAVPLWAERSGPRTSWHPEHIVERYGLFTLIVLGESILAATTAVQAVVAEGGLSGPLLAVGAAGLVLVFSIWWSYFDRPEDGGLRNRPELAFAWGYGHYAIFAALAALGAGLQVSAEAVQHHGGLGEVAAAYAVAVPVAVYLLAKGALRQAADPGRAVLPVSIGIAVAVLLLAATAGPFGLPVALVLVAAVPAAALALDLRRRSA